MNYNKNMQKLKITTVGSSAGVVLPKNVLARMKAKKGDTIYLIETKEGYSLTAYDPEFKSQLESAEKVMNRYRNALKELAV